MNQLLFILKQDSNFNSNFKHFFKINSSFISKIKIFTFIKTSKMSMSTYISDLPGPQEEEYAPVENVEVYHEDDHEHVTEHEREHEPHKKNTLKHEKESDVFLKEHLENYDNTQDSPIKVNIKKKDTNTQASSPSLYESIKREFNEQNILIFILLFIATLPQSNEIIRKGLMSFANTSGYSHMSITLIKCALLLLVFILVKRFLFSS
jgi:hypothetical protein